jgi:hypothetical protein
MILALLLAAAAVAMPAGPASDDKSTAVVTAYIERCATEWAMNIVVHDPEAIDRCIADDYRGFSSDGKLSTKATLGAPGERAGKAAGLYYSKPHFMNPTLAIVQGEEWWEPRDGSGKQHLIWTDIWMFRAGKWQVAASQDSVVPFDQPLLN